VRDEQTSKKVIDNSEGVARKHGLNFKRKRKGKRKALTQAKSSPRHQESVFD
jgi:hypothetical protein